MVTYLPENPSPLAYTPADVTPHDDQYLNVFVPDPDDFPEPPDGYPVWVLWVNGDFTGSSPLSSIGPTGGFQYAMLQMGCVVISAGCTESGVDYSAFPPNSGLGLFWPPGHASGKYENKNYPMAEKDVIYCRTYVAKNAADITGTGVKINNNKVSIGGLSGGGITPMWITMGPASRAAALGTTATDSQYGFSTRCAVGVHRLSNVSFLAFALTNSISHFGTAPNTEAENATLADVPAGVLSAYSAINYESAFLNAQGLTRWMFTIGATNISHVFDPPPVGTETDNHSAAGAFIWKTRYPDFTEIWNQGELSIYQAAGYELERSLTDHFYMDAAVAQFPEALRVLEWMDALPKATPGPAVWPVALRNPEAARIHTGTLTSTSNTDMVPANANRRYGVWIYNTNDSAAAGFAFSVAPGSVAAPPALATDFLTNRAVKHAGAAPKVFFIPGTGPIVGKKISSNATWLAVEY